jgi:ankyrin repeat protein
MLYSSISLHDRRGSVLESLTFASCALQQGGSTPLHFAAQSDDALTIVKLLVDAGSDVNAKDVRVSDYAGA